MSSLKETCRNHTDTHFRMFVSSKIGIGDIELPEKLSTVFLNLHAFNMQTLKQTQEEKICNFSVLAAPNCKDINGDLPHHILVIP